ncbi:hypothetical protein FVEN_g12955 [Fusarium venenatum]|nr:hypothetical protein FVEN_g12955 [Fusarium venenatum]
MLDGDNKERHQYLTEDLCNKKHYGPKWIIFTSEISTCAGNTQILCVELRVLTHPSIELLSIEEFGTTQMSRRWSKETPRKKQIGKRQAAKPTSIA